MFGILTITTAGLTNCNRAITQGLTFRFTRAAIGTKKWGGELQNVSQLFQHKMDVDMKLLNSDSLTHRIVVMIDNKDVQAGFIAYELGVFAKIDGEAEFLYGYTVSDIGEYIPNKDRRLVCEFTHDTGISTTDNITIVIDDSNVHATMGDIEVVQNAIDNIGARPRLYFSAEEPTDWRDGDVWWEEIGEGDGVVEGAVGVVLHTVPFDATKQFHLEIDGDEETIVNAVDTDTEAGQEDLIFVDI